LTKNATQCSINQQIFRHITERFLSELPKPPLRKVTILSIRDFVASDTEVHNWGHFDRTVYFRIHQEIERRMPKCLPTSAESESRAQIHSSISPNTL
jgi:hypothetical protein